MTRALMLLVLALALLPGAASAFTVSGRFLYEDRIYNGNGYTGTVQNLPIRRARVEIVNQVTTQVLAAGVTDANGAYSIAVNGQTLPVSFYARCLTDGRPTYQIWVVDAPQRDLMGGWVPPNAPIHAITTDPVLAHSPALNHSFGDYLIQDTDGHGVAQAFNIFDCAVDFFDWMAQPDLLGRLPNASEYVTFSWGPNNANEASNYTQNTILLSSPGQGNDTDGWSDTVILHETGHWFDDNFSQTDNPGGAHFIGDNNANVLLCYGEGAATFHCAKVREYRALTRGVDQRVSLYADLAIPPAVGTPGGLSFSYDFETGNFGDTGTPIGQRGSANETNVTSALWDMVDGPGTPDATPGVDDDIMEVADSFAWDIEADYLRSLPAAEPITVEDYVQGWFTLNGAGAMQAGMDQIFVTLARMPFASDAFESDNTLATAGIIIPRRHNLAAGHVVINEIELGATDGVELYNGSPDPVDITGWRIEVFANGLAPEESLNVYVFPTARSLGPGETVTLHEGGTALDDGPYHVYGGDRQAFNAAWNHGLDGAVLVRNASNTPIDFVKWRNAGGANNNTAVPPPLVFNGVLDSPTAPNTLARDIHGTDLDNASDFANHYGSMGSPNHSAPRAHTVYNVGDQDLVRFEATANTRYGFEARSYYSASDALIELLNAGGTVIGSNDNIDPSVRDARLDFFAASAGTYYLRVTHVGANTDWAEYDLLAFVRPGNNVFLPPAGLVARANNSTDTQDHVHLQWVNASVYDSVRVYRGGTRIATLEGSSSQYLDQANRGLYLYEVSGVQAGTETPRASDYEFAGLLRCNATDDFEAGNANLWVRPESAPGSRWDVGPLAQAGLFGFTDSPVGNYRGAPVEGTNVNAIAEFGVPAHLSPGATLEWDQICITEATFDFCIVEISNNDGSSWTELARYDQSSDPRWQDNVAGPTDWRHETISLAAYANQTVIIRFRLQSDQLLELDGWYVDNVRLGNAGCQSVSVNGGVPVALEFGPPSPHPVRSTARFAFGLPARAERVALGIYDIAGRSIRSVDLGALAPGYHAWTWDGRDDHGRIAASGAYFARLIVSGRALSQKVLKLAP